jgi:TolB-like protein/class 3 adenylate cyclase
MLIEASSEVKFEIGHVLFIDIVGYSKLLITEQSEQIQKLREIVRTTEQFRLAEAEGKLLRLSTGDGGALVFRNSPEAPVLCAMEITKELRKKTGSKEKPQLRLRMGIHSGPVNEISDLNEQANIAGAGINIAQRVMDCGDAGHILLSKRVADDLEQYPQWHPLLHNLGECEVKHGATVALVNLYSDEIGNPELPKKFKGHEARKEKVDASTPVLRKSIAVLPFENLSEDKGNAYFADGIQEEILTRLSRIGDLKVISRTSTQRFRNSPEDISHIARQLGVANILEGGVRKAGDQVRVHVQLIDAESDSHLWAERYDRKLTDIFAVESDIAAKIADALQAKLTGAERHAIASRPTENSEAHELYLRGRFYWNKWLGPDFDKSRRYYQQAIDLDPNYALAYAGLADFYGFAFARGLLPPEEKWAKMEEDTAKKALELDPMLGEAYNPLAAAKLYFHRDWPAAEGDFRRGFELSPNFAEMHVHYALCLVFFDRNQEAFAEMQRALELDPLSSRFGLSLGWLLFFTRQYDAAINQYRKTLEIDPNAAIIHEWLGYAYEKKQMQKEAIAEWSKGLSLIGTAEDASLLERTYAASGFVAALRALAQERLERFKQKTARGDYVPAYEYVMAHMRLGDKEQAFGWLAKAFAERNRLAFEITVNPTFDPLRSDPRFQKLWQEQQK